MHIPYDGGLRSRHLPNPALPQHLPPAGRPPGHRPAGPGPLPGGGGALHHLPQRPDRGTAAASFFSASPKASPVKSRPPVPWSVPPDITLRSYLSPRPNPRFIRFSHEVERKIGRHSLGRLAGYMTDSGLIGKGSSKDCYRIDDRHVLVVKERSGGPLHSELITLDLLDRAGFPVVKTWEAGKIPGRYGSGHGTAPKNEAMVQERLEDFVTFERFKPENLEALLASPRMNQNTLDSLVAIRDLMRRENIAVGDLQGGLREDGVFVLADVGHISAASDANFLQKRGLKNLDQTIAALGARLHGA